MTKPNKTTKDLRYIKKGEKERGIMVLLIAILLFLCTAYAPIELTSRALPVYADPTKYGLVDRCYVVHELAVMWALWLVGFGAVVAFFWLLWRKIR